MVVQAELHQEGFGKGGNMMGKDRDIVGTAVHMEVGASYAGYTVASYVVDRVHGPVGEPMAG